MSAQPDGAELLALAERVVALAAGDEQVEAVVVRDLGTEIKVYEGEIESLSSAQSQGIGIRVIKGGRQGFAYAGTLDVDVAAETLAEARDNAGFGTVDEFAGLAEPDGVAPAELPLWSDALASFPAERKVALALELERAVRGADPRISGIESAEYVDSMSEAAIVTTTGIRAYSRDTGCYVSTYAMAEQDGEVQTGFGFSVGRDPAELDVDRAATDAAERATRMLGATKPRSERLTVVLDPWVTAQFLGILAFTLNGESVLKGRSLFADRLGEEVASPLVTLVDDPTDIRAFTATEIDGEGLATRRNVLIDGGRLERFVHNAYTARRAGTVSTGSAVRGFKSTPGVGCMATSLVPGSQGQAELVRLAGEGVLVQEVAGLHSGVNPVSGDFSTGAEGLRIRGGELAEPVREFTIASTLQKMLRDVVAVGNDLQWLPMPAAGVSLVITDVTVSGA
ncbi:TldD/PmbA family protein [Rhabdothermincola sp.]|uniref:TldD/PmbA family protein n=1 Tax=Rhabdothermincola sp. TaxID=2820405 RepID=UPI002FE082FF